MTYATKENMDSLRALAATKQHSLAPDMLNRTLTIEAARSIWRNLSKCADKEITVTESAQPARPANIPPPISAFRHIPVGRYATPSRTGNNDFDFWKIERPEGSNYAGYTFVKRVIGGHDDTDVRGMQARYACQAIVEYGIEQASLKFGQLLKICGDCGRHLTDEESRRIGKGPICRSK